MLQWCETLLAEYLDPQIQRICLIDAPVVLGWKEIRLPSPVFVGDTIRSETEVLSVRESRSRPAKARIRSARVRAAAAMHDLGLLGTLAIAFSAALM